VANFNWPINPTTVTSGPAQFVYDGVDTEVSLDTGTPSNSRPLPIRALDSTGAEVDFATEAKQDSIITELNNVEADVEAAVTQLTTLNTVDFATEAKQDSIITELNNVEADVEAAVSQLTTLNTVDFATEAKQDTIITALNSANTSLDNIEAVDFATEAKQDTQITHLSTLAGAVSGTEMQVDVISSALPTGAATAANQSTANTSLASIDTKLSSQATAANQTTANTSLSSIDGKLPALSSGKVPVEAALLGRSKVEIIRNAYASTSVTTGAYVQLIGSTSAEIKKLQIFDSSGETLKLAVGAAASEVDQIYIFPGGNGDVELSIAAGSRISVRAVSANATSGELIINCFS
jgi:hypothetical protein